MSLKDGRDVARLQASTDWGDYETLRERWITIDCWDSTRKHFSLISGCNVPQITVAYNQNQLAILAVILATLANRRLYLPSLAHS